MSNFFDDIPEEGFPVFSPVCTYCSHVRGYRVCDAYELVPEEIWKGANLHKQPYEGDKGIQFEKWSEEYKD